jgi:hypothetical protein
VEANIVLDFNSLRKFSIVKVAGNSYGIKHPSQVVTQDELLKLRRMSPEEFEAAFNEQLRLETRASLRSTYFMKEAYRRRDWSKEFSEFKRYCIFKMKMSDSDFYRKYAIMKTLEELPELEEKMLDGTLNQATVSKTIQFINKESRISTEPLTLKDKRQLFAQIENKTESEIEREFAIISPFAALPDKCKQISEDGFLRQFTSDQALEEKLARLRNLLAHSFTGKPTDCELFHKLADLA